MNATRPATNMEPLLPPSTKRTRTPLVRQINVCNRPIYAELDK